MLLRSSAHGSNIEERHWIAWKVSEARLHQKEDGQTRLEGHAAVFDVLSDPIGFGDFREVVKPGAFSKTLQEGGEVFALWNHNTSQPLARRSNETLELEEDERGLRFAFNINRRVSYALDLAENVGEGLVDSMSFGFRAIKDAFRTEDDVTIRELHEVELFDVSPVTMPAYPQTDVQIRAKLEALQKRGGLTPQELRRIFRLDSIEAGEPERKVHSPLARMLAELDLLERGN